MREGGGVSHVGEWAAGSVGGKKKRKERKKEGKDKIIIL